MNVLLFKLRRMFLWVPSFHEFRNGCHINDPVVQMVRYARQELVQKLFVGMYGISGKRAATGGDVPLEKSQKLIIERVTNRGELVQRKYGFQKRHRIKSCL